MAGGGTGGHWTTATTTNNKKVQWQLQRARVVWPYRDVTGIVPGHREVRPLQSDPQVASSDGHYCGGGYRRSIQSHKDRSSPSACLRSRGY